MFTHSGSVVSFKEIDALQSDDKETLNKKNTEESKDPKDNVNNTESVATNE